MDQLASLEQSIAHYRQLLGECYDDDETSWLEEKIKHLESLAEELLNERH